MNPRDRRSWIIFDILQVIERTGANRVDAKKKNGRLLSNFPLPFFTCYLHWTDIFRIVN
jgi:hypothetical protein